MNPFSMQKFYKDPERVALAVAVVALLLAPAPVYVQVSARIEDTIVQSLLLLLFGGSFFVRGAAAIGKGLASENMEDAGVEYE